jgi:alanine racemase
MNGRWAWAEVSPAAIEHNVRALRGVVDPAGLWAVVKADGYGHGSVLAARAALAGGAEGLCVAMIQEGVLLREAGIAAPILVLSEQPPEELPDAIRHFLRLTVYRREQIDALEALGAVGHPVHLKVDTGMRRVGASDADVVAIAQSIVASSAVSLEGLFTHLAVADDPDDPFTAAQLARFEDVRYRLSAVGVVPRMVHAANSAGGLAHPTARYAFVRAGIAIYGISPGAGVDRWCQELGLVPALALKARVSFVKRVRAGEGISYGLRHHVTRDCTIATVPIGYADGVSRRLFSTGGEVLVGGVRRPIAGVVTMDQLMVDCGDDPVEVGDEVVLLGEQGGQWITVAEWADRLGTIGYEVVCGISARVERRAV